MKEIYQVTNEFKKTTYFGVKDGKKMTKSYTSLSSLLKNSKGYSKVLDSSGLTKFATSKKGGRKSV